MQTNENFFDENQDNVAKVADTIYSILLIVLSCGEKLKLLSIKTVVLKTDFGMQVILDVNLPVLVELDPNYKAKSVESLPVIVKMNVLYRPG